MERYSFLENGMGRKILCQDPDGDFVRYEEAKDAFDQGFKGGVRNAAQSSIARLRYALENCESVLKLCERQPDLPELLKSYVRDANKVADRSLNEALKVERDFREIPCNNLGGVTERQYEFAAERLAFAIEGELDGLSIDLDKARKIMDFVLTETLGRARKL